MTVVDAILDPCESALTQALAMVTGDPRRLGTLGYGPASDRSATASTDVAATLRALQPAWTGISGEVFQQTAASFPSGLMAAGALAGQLESGLAELAVALGVAQGRVASSLREFTRQANWLRMLARQNAAAPADLVRQAQQLCTTYWTNGAQLAMKELTDALVSFDTQIATATTAVDDALVRAFQCEPAFGSTGLVPLRPLVPPPVASPPGVGDLDVIPLGSGTFGTLPVGD